MDNVVTIEIAPAETLVDAINELAERAKKENKLLAVVLFTLAGAIRAGTVDELAHLCARYSKIQIDRYGKVRETIDIL